MKMSVLAVVLLAATTSLSGCKFIKTSELQKKEEQSSRAGDADRVAAIISSTYDANFLPLVEKKAVDLGVLLQAINANLDDAGKEYGVRAGGSGGAWNFAVKGTAKILEVDTKSKAGIAKIDINGDGKADAQLQIGPVVQGTALRDFAPSIYDFSKFRDQIEFAKLGRGLNMNALKAVSEMRDSLESKTITFIGVVAIRSAGDILSILPVSLKEQP